MYYKIMYYKIKNYIKKDTVFFTDYNCCLLFICYITNFQCNFLHCITTCWCWTIFITFNCSVLLDNTSFTRMANRLNVNMLTFHVGNILVHNLPCYVVYKYYPVNIYFLHGLIALLIKFLWIYYNTNGTLDLQDIYIPFEKNTIKKLYILSCSTCLSVPFFYNRYIIV